MNLLFFLKGGFGIKFTMKVDIPLNKETKQTKPETNICQPLAPRFLDWIAAKIYLLTFKILLTWLHFVP